jgi:hypothetical protein
MRIVMVLRKVLIALVKSYRRLLSPYLGGGCRFEPSCSEYALAAFARFGAIRGMRLTVSRLLRCRPEFPCGADPVPDAGHYVAALKGELLLPEEHVEQTACTDGY